MTSIIPTAVLRAAVLSAFDLGRYSVTFTTAPAGDDLAVVPSAIILNLEEQDDDLLGSEPFELFTETETQELFREVCASFGIKPEVFGVGRTGVGDEPDFADPEAGFVVDEHGPAVPSQDAADTFDAQLVAKGEISVNEARANREARKHGDSPSVQAQGEPYEAGLDRKLNGFFPAIYEFALQDYWAASDEAVFEHLADIELYHAPDLDAAAVADWVHVYDRVTRERRTLKRPGVDRIVKGLADAVADLRGGHAGDPLEAALSEVVGRHAGRIAAPGQWRVWRDEAGRVRWEKFDT